MIYIEPCGGLGNRMRAIDSAIQLAKFKNTELIIIWKINDELGAPFETLFEPFDINSRVKKVVNFDQSGISNDPYNLYFTKLKKFIKPCIIDNPDWEYEQIAHEYRSIFRGIPKGDNNYNKDFETYVKDTWSSLWPKKNYYIKSYSRFFGNPLSNYHLFKPVSHIRSSSLDMVRKCGTFSCGIHIRRTDQIDAIEVSTTDKYINLIEQELKKNNSTMFLLASDSIYEKEKLLLKFPGKIITSDVVQGRTNIIAMQDALTELYALANMRKIIGSFCSSYTETAISYLNIKPYVIAL